MNYNQANYTESRSGHFDSISHSNFCTEETIAPSIVPNFVGMSRFIHTYTYIHATTLFVSFPSCITTGFARPRWRSEFVNIIYYEEEQYATTNSRAWYIIKDRSNSGNRPCARLDTFERLCNNGAWSLIMRALREFVIKPDGIQRDARQLRPGVDGAKRGSEKEKGKNNTLSYWWNHWYNG